MTRKELSERRKELFEACRDLTQACRQADRAADAMLKAFASEFGFDADEHLADEVRDLCAEWAYWRNT